MLSESALQVVRTGFTDCTAVLFAGLNEPVTGIVRRSVYRHSESRICLGGERATAPDAALVGAVAAHVLDWDDYAFSNHPSAVLVPVVLAVADATGASGNRMAAAYVAGYEIWADLMQREPDHLNSKGWHPTAVFGPIGAAAAAANLMRLPPEACRNAISLAASFAGGVMANFGSMAKSLHAGRAAQSGIIAARYAADGMQAGVDVLESPLGLLKALSPKGRVDVTTPFNRGKNDWLIEKTALNIKRYPVVGAAQRTIDAVLAWREKRDVNPDHIRELVPRVSARHAVVMPFHTPSTALEAKFSLEFAVAAAILRGKVGLSEVTDSFVRSTGVQALMRKVRIETTEDADPENPNAAPEDYVRVALNDGTTLVTDKVKKPLGHARKPLDRQQLWEKFSECTASAGVSIALASRLFDVMQRIDELKSTGDIPTVP
jgi:2-methylcitrate dehydratase PrpD